MQNNKLQKIRHSLSHLMSMAIMEKYPKAGLGVGPAIENGFYQDYDLPESLSEKDFAWIQKRMKEMIRQKIKFIQHQMSFDEALKLYEHDPYKTEMINDLRKAGEKDVSFFKSDWFDNLCLGPHVIDTSEIDPDAFKLTHLAGVYWRSDEKNKQLQRITGVAFNSKKELDDYLEQVELAEKRDHRKLGKEMDLFIFSDLIGAGLPVYTFKGAIVRKEIVNHINELQKGIGYQEVHTPNMNRAELFKVSGHYEKFKDDMFKVVSNYTKEEFFLKPMNCPHHTQVFASQQRSYKDLPIRIADFANLYRDEKPGELNGLTRLRCFAQDDGHSFCREDQIVDEFLNVLGIVRKAMATYGMECSIRLSLWDPEKKEKYLGDPEIWEKSQKLLEKILIDNKISYIKAPGEAALYGPKMDLITKDSLGREWQLSTIQLDFIMPQRFGLKYIDQDGNEQTPVMVHRAIIGSPERFLGILLEHYAGNFPVWLSPIQVLILSVSEKFGEKANELADKFKKQGIRAEVDNREESVGKKIAGSRKQRVPYTIVFGEREEKSSELPVRLRDGKVENFEINKFIEKIKNEIEKRVS